MKNKNQKKSRNKLILIGIIGIVLISLIGFVVLDTTYFEKLNENCGEI